MKKIFPTSLAVKTTAALLILPLAQFSQAAVNSLSDIKVSGFGSIVGNVSDDEAKYLRNAKVTDKPDFVRETRVGVQFNAPLTKDFEFITQFTGDYQDDDYSINAEWILGKWRINDTFTLRGGRMIIPFLAQSDTIYVNFAHPWIRNPASVYEMLPVSNYNGIDLLANIPVGDAYLSFQPFFGNAELQSPFGLTGTVTTTIDQLYGMKVRFETENHVLFVSAMNVNLSMNDPGIVTALTGLGILPSTVLINNILNDENLEFYALGWTGRFGDLEIQAEMAKRGLAVPQVAQIEGAYVTAIYNVGNFSPYLTLERQNTEKGRPQMETSTTLGLRQYLTSNSSLKYELRYASIDDKPGNRGLFALSNPATTDFPDNVALFSVGLDVSF